MSTSVKHIHNGMRGAPQVSGTPGTQIAALDAFFITGWGLTTALSVTVAGGVATAQLVPGETFDRDSVVLVAGATPGALNGEARVASASNTSITWATTAPDGVATGTITIKYAPQTSWSKVFAGTNKAVYRSSHPQSAGHYLRVDDTGTTTARVRGFESMSDVDTGVGPFPTDAIMTGGGYIWKSTVASATAAKYRLFADERFVFFCNQPGSAVNAAYLSAASRCFGDPIALAPGGDPWATVLSANGASSGASGYSSPTFSHLSPTNGFICCPRAFSAIGGAVSAGSMPFTGAVNTYSGNDSFLGAMPSEVDGQVKMTQVFIREPGAGKPPRAIIPGVYYIPQSGAYGPLADGDLLAGTGALAGRRLMAIAGAGTNSFAGNPDGAYLMDITGPWR